MSRRTSVRAGAAGAVLLGLLLAGCGQSAPGVVAYVGSDTITQGELDSAVAGVQQTVQEGQQVSPQAVVNALIHGEIAARIAGQDNLTITDAERDAIIKGSNLEPLLGVEAAKPVAYDLADQEIVAKALGDQAYLQRVAEQKVTLNPRYGVLDASQQLIVSDESGSLAKPASPTPAP